MSPSAVPTPASNTVTDEGARNTNKKALKSSGSLNNFTSFDVTPVIGTEFENIDLVALLHDSNSDQLLRDLAILSLLT
jgi:hypothetical protein